MGWRKTNWEEVIRVARQEAERFYSENLSPLTLRGLFYILVSRGVLPNTRAAYKGLSEQLAKARYEGKFPWHLLKDTTRRRIPLEAATSYPTKPLTAEELKKILEDYISAYTNVSVNPWEDQKYRVIVVVEKEALGDLVARMVEDVFPWGVYQVRVIRGYDSATDVHELAEAIAEIPQNQTPVVLQLGDFDPSGEDIVRDFRRRLAMLSKRQDIIFEKVAVTLEQIIELQLPCKPETADEIAKMRRDPRYKSYIQKLMSDERARKLVELYGSPEIRVELDALIALRPDVARQVLKAAIEKYFDWNIYNNVTKKKEEELKKKAEEIKQQSLAELQKLFSQK
jgi:hypothetical protein